MCIVITCISLTSLFTWLQVSEAGVHRPHVAGISGRENEGAYSIVLAGGYEDDVVSYNSCYSELCNVIDLNLPFQTSGWNIL